MRDRDHGRLPAQDRPRQTAHQVEEVHDHVDLAGQVRDLEAAPPEGQEALDCIDGRTRGRHALAVGARHLCRRGERPDRTGEALREVRRQRAVRTGPHEHALDPVTCCHEGATQRERLGHVPATLALNDESDSQRGHPTRLPSTLPPCTPRLTSYSS